MSWTEERVELLKKLWTDGLSASQIAGRLGGVTRNAVIGKVHRLGLSGRATTSRIRSVRPRARVVPFPSRSINVQYRSHGNVALKALFLPALNPQQAIEPHIEELDVPLAERVDLLSLKECMCRWPLGDPQDEAFRFCGRKTSEGATYCEHHARIAYQPLQRRKRRVLEFA